MQEKKLLRVDLDNMEIKKEKIPEHLVAEYLGGSGLATKYLYDELKPKTDPLSSENKIIFAAGPFQGYPVPGAAKWSVVSKSPLTKTFGVSTAGAEWGVNLKKAGYTLIIVEGKANDPVYLYLNGDTVELRSADNLWGKDAVQTCELVRELNPEVDNLSVATIGQAGEKEVGIACIVADDHSFAGRCGFGAVLGSKNLKAIAVKGTNDLSYHNEKNFKELNKELYKRLSKNAADGFRPHGTAVVLQSCEEVGDLPIKYWNKANWPEGAEKIGAPNFTEEVNAKSWPCQYCPVGCHRHVDFEYEGERIKGAGAEYESLAMLGSNCLVDDPKAISKANDICNRLGIDTISAGAYIGFTMECYEKGILTSEDLNGMEADWGNKDFMIEMVRKIGNKMGFGAIFSEGINKAADKIGDKSKELTVEVKNLDFPAHDPRSYFSLGINYATSTRGACHLRGYTHIGEGGDMLIPEMGLDEIPERFTMKKKAWLTKLFQDIAALHDSLVLCIFIPVSGMTLTDTVNQLNNIEGTKYTPEDLMEIGDRIVTLQRLINNQDGYSRKDDRLPSKMFESSEENFRSGQVPEPFETHLLEFYRLRGWDDDGRPKAEKLKELGI